MRRKRAKKNQDNVTTKKKRGEGEEREKRVEERGREEKRREEKRREEKE